MPKGAKNVGMQPRDKYMLVYFIFVLHGLGTLLPWNMFITAKSYFVDFKLDAGGDAGGSDFYSSNFMQYLSFASQIPNLLFNWLNIFVRMGGGDLTKRIIYSIVAELLIFTLTIVLAMLDTSTWSVAFFWLTMASVAALNMANGVYQNTIYGMAATLPIKYTGAVVLGSNLSGLFASLISLCSDHVFTSRRTAAIYYFVTAMIVLLVCFDTYFALPLNKFFRHYELLQQQDNGEQQQQDGMRSKEIAFDVDDDDEDAGQYASSAAAAVVPYWHIFKRIKLQLLNIFLVFFVTLSIFPALHSDIKPTNVVDFIVPPTQFTAITCFLTFNLFAMLGSLTTSWLQWPSPKYLCVPVVARLLLMPLFLFCNYQPKGVLRTLPVYVDNDWVYWTLAVIMSYSSGYLSSLGMMYAPKYVEPKHQVTAGMYAAAMLITGIFSGIMFSFLWPKLV